MSRRSKTQTENESQTKTKAKTPSAFVRLRRDKHAVSYKFPDNFDDVLALPGIGRYTAGAICSIAFNQPKPILDGNVIRVLTRIFGIAENPREKKTNARLWKMAEELVAHASAFAALRRDKSRFTLHASRFKPWTSRLRYTSPRRETTDEDDLTASQFNQSLMELGALVCTPRNPQCPICPVKELCVAFRDNRVCQLPNLGKRTATTARHFVAFVVEQRGRFLVRQRPAGVVNAHLWEFPNVEIGARLSGPQRSHSPEGAGKIFATHGSRTGCGSGDPRSVKIAEAAAKIMGFRLERLTPLCTVKHSITRYRITLKAYRGKTGGGNVLPCRSGRWVTTSGLQRLALAGAHRKILRSLNQKA